MKKFICFLFAFALILSGCGDNAVIEPEITRVVAPEDIDETYSPSYDTVTEPSDTENDQIQLILDSMSVEEKVGQLILVRIDSNEETALANIEKYHVGGYVLFASDFQDRDMTTAKEYIEKLQSASEIPLTIAVDEEGGTVVRVSKFSQYASEKFKSPRELLASDSVVEDTQKKCELLSSLGINLNLAPVADISTDKNDFIYYRSAGDLESAVEYVKDFVTSSVGVGTTLKHFPGYGGNADTHTGTATDTRDYEVFIERDFLPFIAGIEAGADIIMVSHNTVLCMDENYPASLSKEVHRIIREELGFNGPVTTDDLSMDAIADLYGIGEAAVLAFEAGNDIICTSELSETYNSLLSAVTSGRITEESLNESVKRILYFKINKGIIK